MLIRAVTAIRPVCHHVHGYPFLGNLSDRCVVSCCSQGTESRAHERGELKAESCCVFTETRLGALKMLVFVTLKDSFIEGFLRLEHVKYDSCDLVCGRCDGLRSTQAA